MLPGFSAKGAIIDELDGTVQVVMAQHLTKGEQYHYRPEHRLKITPPRNGEKYLIKPGDILFMSRGVNNYAVLIEDIPQPAIAPLTFYILRPRGEVIPAYLAWCLNQEPAREQISSIRTGAGTPMVPRNGLAEITIPLPPLDVQQQLATFADLQAREAKLLRELVDETERMRRLAGQRLLTKLIGAIGQ